MRSFIQKLWEIDGCNDLGWILSEISRLDKEWFEHEKAKSRFPDDTYYEAQNERWYLLRSLGRRKDALISRRMVKLERESQRQKEKLWSSP